MMPILIAISPVPANVGTGIVVITVIEPIAVRVLLPPPFVDHPPPHNKRHGNAHLVEFQCHHAACGPLPWWEPHHAEEGGGALEERLGEPHERSPEDHRGVGREEAAAVRQPRAAIAPVIPTRP